MVFLIATVLGLLFAVQIHFSGAAMGNPVSWGLSFYFAFGDIYEWALLSPVIFWFCRRSPLTRESWLRSLGGHLAGAVVLSLVHAVLCAWAEQLLYYFCYQPESFTPVLIRLLARRTNFNLAIYAGIAATWYARENFRRTREREQEVAQLAGHLAQAQLKALRMQLNPHFLFNTLNTISSLMLTDVMTANKMITRFGNLLRMTLDAGEQQEVPLRQEIEFLQRYLEIEQLRFGERLSVRVDTDAASSQAAVPNFILQPLVENAICHAVQPNEAGGTVALRAAIRADNLVIEIEDSGQGETASAAPRPATVGSGIGLKNTRQRLRTLYGDRQALSLAARPGGGTTVSLIIPYRVAGAAGGGAT